MPYCKTSPFFDKFKKKKFQCVWRRPIKHTKTFLAKCSIIFLLTYMKNTFYIVPNCDFVFCFQKNIGFRLAFTRSDTPQFVVIIVR